VHGTTGERPVDRYEREKDLLTPARVIPSFDARPVEVRKVRNDSHISFSGVSYSVDPCAVGYSVTVRPEGSRVGSRFEVYLGEELVAVHVLHAKGTRRVTLPEHAVAVKAASRSRTRPKGKRTKAVGFDQVLGSWHGWSWSRVAVEVETRSLDLYEHLLAGQP
jgi:hypothetical protein